MALLLGSCDPTGTFDTPQSNNSKLLATFPENLQGKYVATQFTDFVRKNGFAEQETFTWIVEN